MSENSKKKTHRIFPAGKRFRKITVEDLLARNEINIILDDLDKKKPEIKDMLVIYTDKAGNRSFILTEDTLISTATWMCEATKYDIMLENTDDLEEE
jgi:hypothetical protein